jgi:hypothetical protein
VTRALGLICEALWVNANAVIADGCETNIGQPAANLVLLGLKTYDIPALCDASPSINCPGGQPGTTPAEIQLTGSEVAAAERAGAPGFDISARLGALTLGSVPASYQGVDCTFNLDTSRGALTTALVRMTLTKVDDSTAPGDYRLVATDVSLSDVETADVAIGGGFGCQILNLSLPFFIDSIRQTLEARLSETAVPMCAVNGPEIVAVC